jgi:fibronectin-binding autotransporter adhesin
MKNRTLIWLICFLFTNSILTENVLFSANRYSVANGNWNATSTWSATSGGAPGASVPVAGDNVFIENGHTVTVTANAACSSITFTGLTATLTVNATRTATVSGDVTLYKQVSNNAACTVTGGGSLSCANLNVGSAVNPPTTGFSTSTFTHTFTSTVTSLSISGNLVINSYYAFLLHLRNGVFNLEAGTVTVGGSVTISSALFTTSTFSMASGSQSGMLIFSGATPFNITGIGTASIILNGTSTLVNYARTGDQTAYATTYTNMTLSGSGVKTVTGTNVDGILSMEGTATAGGTTPTFGAEATLQYKGSGAQTTGIEFPASFSGSGGIKIDNTNNVTLNSNRTITALLTFVNGKIITGTDTLALGSSAVVTGAGAGKYIYGNLMKGIAAGTATKTFEVGDASSYTPVTLNFTGTTNGTGSITVKTTSGDHPNIGSSAIIASSSVNRYWTVTNSGVTGFTSCAATFTFVAGDIDGGADYNSFFIGAYSASSWTYPTIGTRTSTSTQCSGMTTFGELQIGNVYSDFRSAATGNWNQTSTWEIYYGGSWIPATKTPVSVNGIITIRNTHTVTATSSITVDQVTVAAGGTLALGSNIVVADGTGTDLSVSGTINCGTYSLTGSGSFALASSATIGIGSPQGITSSGATGNVQTASRSFSTGANYTYNGSASQVTGNGLPATVNNLTVNNSAGVALMSSVTINNTLTLTNGTLTVGAHALTFQNSNTPVTRTSGTLTTDATSDLAFGSPGNTGGAAFTIPSGTFTSAPVINNFSIYRVNSLTLNNQMLSVGRILLCNGPLNTNGNLTLLSTAVQTALIDGSGTGTISGNVIMQRYLASGFGYKYISSPFQAATVNELSDEVNLADPFPPVYKYDESRTTSGWVSYVTPSNTLNTFEGYAVNFGSSATPVTVDITGVVNNGNQSRTIYNNNNTYTLGFNLAGNPYPSPINWDAASGWTKTNIDDALYYFKASATEQYGGTYSTYISGVSSDGLATNIIPSMQGFFVHVTDGSYPVTGTLASTNGVRVTDLTHSFLKSAGIDSRQILRMKTCFMNDTLEADPMVVYFDGDATNNFDSKYDALKLYNTDLNFPNLYSFSTDHSKLSINGLPFYTEDFIRIALGLKLNKAGDIIFRLINVDDQIAAEGVYLIDDLAGKAVDMISDKEYAVNLPVGEYTDRFFLNIGAVQTSDKEISEEEDLISIYSSHGILKVNISGLPGDKGLLQVFDLTGRILYSKQVYENGYHEYTPGLADGMYIIRFEYGNEIVTTKIIIQNQ